MDDDGPTASIIYYVALLLVDVFFYGFGAALVLLNEKEIERRADEEKDKKALKLKRIISNPTGYVNTVQLITTLINVMSFRTATADTQYFAMLVLPVFKPTQPT